MAIPRALHQALLQEPGYEAWSAALEAASHMRLDALEALLPEIEPLLDAWPVEELGLTWGLADDVFRENKTVPGFLLVRHVHVAGVYADASKLFDELFATRHPHRIRSIDASGVDGGDWRLGGAGLARLARCERLSHLERLHLTRAGLGPDALGVLRRMPGASRLRWLSLAHNELGPLHELFAGANPFTALEELDLEATGLDDEGLVRLAAASPPLRKLRISGNPAISPAGVAALERARFLPTLKTLALGGTLGAGAFRAAAPGALIELDITDAREVSAGGLTGSPLCRALETLALRRCGLGAADIAGLSAPALAHLDLEGNPIGDEGARALTRLTGLRTLGVAGCGIGEAGLAALVSSLPLESLVFADNRLDAFPVPVHAASSKLELDLSKIQLPPGALAALARWPVKLQMLALERCGLDASAIAPLAGAPIFGDEPVLVLDGNFLGTAGVMALASAPLPEGCFLSLEDCGLDDVSARAMASSPSFATVSTLLLDDNALTAAGYRALARSKHFARVRDSLELDAKIAEREGGDSVESDEPDDPDHDVGAALEIHTDCERCHQPVHINALATMAHCRACQHDLELSHTVWAAVFKDVLEGVGKCAHGIGAETRFINGPARGIHLLYARFDPYCFGCKTDLDVADLAAHAGSEYPCPGCDKRWFVRRAPAETHAYLSLAALLVAEDPASLTSGERRTPPNAGRAIVFACPSCGAGLRVTGADRMVDCNHCASSVYLPDDLWLRLHPVSTVRRWFVCYTASPRDDVP